MLAASMNVLVIGGGGREHALVWKLSQSPSVSKIWCAPGNGGISQQAECVPTSLTNMSGIASLSQKLGADLTVVGPEQPLVDGIVDEFNRRKHRIIGPTKKAAQLEGSKVFAKDFLIRNNIPTARSYGVFDSAKSVAKVIEGLSYPIVLKADGLCAGKGVLVAKSKVEALDFVGRVLESREFGVGGDKLLVEEALCGSELSFIVLTDGRDYVAMVPTRDHKRALDGDRGPNTGGMGAYSCDEIISPSTDEEIRRRIVDPTLNALARENCPYRGFLYFGLMLTPDGPKVLEYNCRLGDPETQAIVARMDFDLAEVLTAVAEEELVSRSLGWRPGASICVVMASGGYPGTYETGKQIEGLDEASSVPGVNVFHAGTRREGDLYYTSSGRVLGVTAVGSTLDEARHSAYAAVEKIQFSGRHYRSDIARSGSIAANVGER
jgi:phosphoribosylamine--glycine ligase